ncbi:MAG: hypothetical protein JWN76_1732 [Chitinophagaceae bacterium]|nr:hypothetical protein [Chitinophagaceae bacterium]
MKKYLTALLLSAFLLCTTAHAQKVKTSAVPAAVRSNFDKKYPDAKKVMWEKEDGNYEANWGGKSNEDHAAMFSPSGNFIEIVQAIPVSELPAGVTAYLKEHYKGKKITEAGRVTDAKGRVTYEAEVNKKDIVFDEHGKFLKID